MKSSSLPRFLALAALAAFGFAANAIAQPAPTAAPVPPTFALLSLVGDTFSVVFRREQTGSRLDSNDRREYPIATGAIDDMAVAAAEEVVKRLRPVSPVLRFSIRDARLFALQDKLLVDSADSHALREALAALARENGVSRLILVTKYRDDAKFSLLTGTTGVGKISGLGFYVDNLMYIKTTDTGEGTQGFLGPFAYVGVAVVDVASMTPVRSAQGRESDMQLPLNATGAVRAWDALTPDGKVAALERVLHEAVKTATTAALAD